MTKRLPGRPVVSPEFLHAMFGIGMTLFSWYSPWAWPAWPALTALYLIDSGGDRMEMEGNARAAILIVLIVLNVGIWGATSWGLVKLMPSLRSRLVRPARRS